MESEPLWNKVSDEQLKAMLAKHGIRHDTTVILYGRDVYVERVWRKLCSTQALKDGASAGWRLANLVRRGTAC
ncbi:putative thiosulfate sulfurtransferase [Escherichia coli]|uniref:Putative thiosulfate sulfurtransferase n=1 Tax=Escherichia coli TaxID=562 RepID=A0A376UAP2_ECOLX|nr:putative thiosulfate sulfurtransferase [Escherichia coli]